MHRHKVQLRALSLVKMKLARRSLEILTAFIDESEHLEDLDLSWNDLMPTDFDILFRVLDRNRSLRYINLSCNTIVDKKD